MMYQSVGKSIKPTMSNKDIKAAPNPKILRSAVQVTRNIFLGWYQGFVDNLTNKRPG